MTKHFLNRDIKRLAFSYKKRFQGDTSKWSRADWLFYNAEQEVFQKELRRLYDADRDFSMMHQESIRRMIRINLALRVIPLHQFGLEINL